MYQLSPFILPSTSISVFVNIDKKKEEKSNAKIVFFKSGRKICNPFSNVFLFHLLTIHICVYLHRLLNNAYVFVIETCIIIFSSFFFKGFLKGVLYRKKLRATI